MLELFRGELKDVEDFGELDISEDLGLTSFSTSNSTCLLPIESHEVDAQIFWLKKRLKEIKINSNKLLTSLLTLDFLSQTASRPKLSEFFSI